MDTRELKTAFQKYRNYIVIGIVSVLLLIICPFIGESLLGGGFLFPVTAMGWVLWIGTKVMTAAVNMVIFDSFTRQGKQNVKDDERYLEAERLLAQINPEKEFIPKNPHIIESRSYLKKSISLVFTSLMSMFMISQAVLSFDWIQMLSYLVTLTIGVVFGIEQQAKMEYLWTEHYLAYAKYQVKENAKKNMETSAQELPKQADDTTNNNS